jgi:GR25 family glycosyltransferase involved in LPS biosynthesis
MSINQNNIQYYCLHHSPAPERKEYLIDFFYNQQVVVEWIEDFLPDSNEVINHPQIKCEHAADGSNILNNQEISLILKHILALKKICSIDGYGIIFEDDIKKSHWSFNEYMPLLIEEFEKMNGDILWIGSSPELDVVTTDKIKIVSDHNTLSRLAHCYMVHSKIANQVIDFYKSIIAPADWQWNITISHFNLKSCWSYPCIYQRTSLKEIHSLLR